MNGTLTENRSTNLPALFISLFLAAGAALMAMMSMLFVLTGITSQPQLKNSDPLSMYVLAAGTLFVAILLLPGIYFNGRKFFGASDINLRLPRINDWILIPLLIILWGMTLLFGQLAAGHKLLAIVVLPFANIFAVVLPILLYVRISLRGLKFPSARRSWSVLGASMLITPTLALIFEAIAVGIIVVLLLLYANAVPGLKETFATLVKDMRAGGNSDEEMTRIAASLLFAPGAFVATLSAFSLAVPLIEETFKLAVLWLYLGRIRRPVDGFVLGILCGTAFALVENIGFTSAGSANWISSVAARTTTALPHIFNSGLLGWALVSAWREHRYGRLLAAFIAVILVHGSWNAISLGLAMSSLSSYVAETPLLLQNEIAWFVAWAFMAIGTFLGLLYNNRQMRKVSNADID
jgi:hypothetical protein